MWIFPADTNHAEAASESDFNEAGEVDWNSEAFAIDRGTLEASLGTELSNTFDDDRPPTPAEHAPSGEGCCYRPILVRGARPRRRTVPTRPILRPTSRPKLACGSIFPRNWCWPQKIRSSGRSAKR